MVYNGSMEIQDLFYKNYSNQEIAEALGWPLTRVKRTLKREGLVRTKAQRSMILSRKVKQAADEGRRVYLKGDENPAKRPEVREKIRRRVQESMPQIVESRRKTLAERYGVDNPFRLESVKEKIRKTNLEKYGVDNPNKLAGFKQKSAMKCRDTLAKKYNHVERIDNLKEVYAELGRKLTPREMIELWGCSQANAYIFMHKYHLEEYIQLNESLLEIEVENFLTRSGIKYERHCRSIITPQEIDFYIPEYNLGIEVNDIWSHNATKCSFGGKGKGKRYHFNKSVACEEKGVRLIHIWEYEWHNERQRPILESIILGACNKCQTIYARKCKIEVVESKQMRAFFEQNNVQGFRGGKVAINLVYEGEVVMSYIFGHPFFGKGKYEWEMIRGATKLGYRVIGGASRLWKHFIEEFNPESCVYYIDFNYFNGNSVEKLGLKYIGVKPSFKNYFVKEKIVKNRQPAKHKEIKKLVEEGKVWEVYTAGVKVYLYEKP